MGCGASLPTAEEFLSEFPLPAAQYADLATTDKIVVLKVKHKLVSIRGDFIVEDAEGTPFCKVTVILASTGFDLLSRRRCVIKDMNDKPVACVLEKDMSMFDLSDPLRIYGFKPYFEGQEPTGETQNELPLYAWAKVWQPIKSLRPMLCIQMANGNDSYTQASFETTDYKAKVTSMLAQRISVCKGAEFGTNGCCLIDRATLQFEGMDVYDVTVAKGIDPILMVGFTLCICHGRERMERMDLGKAM